jgi:hypothetical protein
MMVARLASVPDRDRGPGGHATDEMRTRAYYVAVDDNLRRALVAR